MTEEAQVADVADVATESSNGSLMGSVPMDDQQEASAPVVQVEQTEWMWADGMHGEGDRPEWLKERYKSVSDQAQAYTELEKKLGAFKGAPKDGYKFDNLADVPADDPLIQHFSKTFTELGMSQEGFERVVSEYLTAEIKADQTNIAEEIKKLGPQGKEMIKQTNQWMANNLAPEVVKTIQGWIHTAEDMKALDALRAFQPVSRSPVSSDMNSVVSYESVQDVTNEKAQNWGRYQEDVNYRNGLSKRLADAVRREDNRRKA